MSGADDPPAGVRFSVAGPGVALLEIDNKPVNALSPQVRRGIAEALDELEATDRTVRALVVTGTENRFCAGADIEELATLAERGADAVVAMVSEVESLFARLEALPIPVVAAINGPALGGGLEMALSCDLRIAAQTVPIGLTEVRLGVIPGAGGTQRLPRVVGLGRALDMILLSRIVRGERAVAMGLVTELVEPENLMERSVELGAQLASLPAVAVTAAKRAVRAACTPLNIEAERRAFLDAMSSADAIECIQAFLDKRSPSVQHR